jgi:hypothetical protein
MAPVAGPFYCRHAELDSIAPAVARPRFTARLDFGLRP